MSNTENKLTREEEMRIQSHLEVEILHKRAKQELFQLHIKTCIQVSITLLIVTSSGLGYIVSNIAEPSDFKVLALISIPFFAYSMFLGTRLFVDSLKRINSERYAEHIMAGISRDLISPTNDGAELFRIRENLTKEMNSLEKTIRKSLNCQYICIIVGGAIYGLYLALPQIVVAF